MSINNLRAVSSQVPAIADFLPRWRRGGYIEVATPSASQEFVLHVTLRWYISIAEDKQSSLETMRT